MNILLSINILSVLGTSCLMMALATIWFSFPSFGNVLALIKPTATEPTSSFKPRELLVLGLTLVLYVMIVTIIEILVLVAPLLSLAPLILGCALCLFAFCVIALLVLWEERTFAYFLIQAGFAAVFIIGSTVVLQFWPW